jgi:hypothetical protein
MGVEWHINVTLMGYKWEFYGRLMSNQCDINVTFLKMRILV